MTTDTDALERLIRDNIWQPIEDAPNDGSEIVIKGITTNGAAYIASSFWRDEDWAVNEETDDNYINVSHFRPLPDDRLAAVCRELVAALSQIIMQIGVCETVRGCSDRAFIALDRANSIAEGQQP